MTKNERATLEANFKAAWRAAIYAQESAKNPELTPESAFEKDDAKELAARARGYRAACIDVLGYSFHDGKIGATDKVQEWIDEAEQQAAATLTAGWVK